MRHLRCPASPRQPGDRYHTAYGIVGDSYRGRLHCRQYAHATLAMGQNVTVTGKPTLTLNDGGTASYVSGSGTNTLTFSYAVASGQNTPALQVTAVNGTIANLAGNALSPLTCRRLLPASSSTPPRHRRSLRWSSRPRVGISRLARRLR